MARSRTSAKAAGTRAETAVADLAKPRVVEGALQRAVLDVAKLRGWLVFHAFDSRKSTGPGFPDLLMAHQTQRRLLAVELKTESGRLTPDQHRWLLTLHSAGAECDVWRPRHLADGTIAATLTGKTRATWSPA